MIKSVVVFSRRRTLWNTCLNTQWWNMWCPIIPPSTGQSLLPYLYGSPSSELISCPSIRDVSCDICALLMDFEPINGIQKCARLYKYLVKRCSFIEYILLSFLADQIVLSGTSKDDFSALSGLEMTGLKMSFSIWLHRKNTK